MMRVTDYADAIIILTILRGEFVKCFPYIATYIAQADAACKPCPFQGHSFTRRPAMQIMPTRDAFDID